MLISAFNIRYLSTTEVSELTGHMIWTYPDKLVIQKKKKKRIKKVGQNSKTICLWAEELIAVSRITETQFYKDSLSVCLFAQAAVTKYHTLSGSYQQKCVSVVLESRSMVSGCQ